MGSYTGSCGIQGHQNSASQTAYLHKVSGRETKPVNGIVIAYYPDKLEGLQVKSPWVILQEGTNINNWSLQ